MYLLESDILRGGSYWDTSEQGEQVKIRMATYQLQPPERFNFSQPDEWPSWIRRFERFRQASGLVGKEEEKQVNALIYAMGDEADDVMLSFGLRDAEKKKYGTVTSRFEQHFTRRRNTIFEQAKFNQRIQNKGEAVDSFINSVVLFGRTLWVWHAKGGNDFVIELLWGYMMECYQRSSN